MSSTGWYLALCFSAASATNLLPNGGLEEPGWELTQWMASDARQSLARPGRRSGQALQLQGLSGSINVLGISPTVAVEPNRDYLIAVWYRTSAGTRASLGIATFRQPFATAGWKTPRAQYDNEDFPEAPEWRLAHWKIHTAPDAVELKLLLRLNQVGEVWYDDASVVLARPALMVTSLADHAPSGRELRAAVSLPAGTAWSLEVHGAGQLGRVTGRGAETEVKVPFQAADGEPVQALLLAEDGALLDALDGPAPPLAELVVDQPRYRQTIYDSAPLAEVTGRLRIHAVPELRPTLRYRADLAVAGQPLGGQPQAVTTDELSLCWPAPTAPGGYRISAEVAAGDRACRVAAPLRRLPKAAHEVLIDHNNRLLVDGRPFYPRGFYGVPDDPAQIKAVADAGYNMAVSYSTSPAFHLKWLDMLETAGLRGMVHVPWEAVPNADLAKMREGIRQVKDHPALLGWYLIDEPSPTRPGQTPAEVQRAYDTVRDEDPYRPVGVCINVPSNEAPYAEAMDILMIDPYPLVANRQPLRIVADRQRHAEAAMAGRKPVWNIPQTFGWDVITGLEGPPSYLTPKPDEIRALVYLAVATGSRGLAAYCYHVYTEFDAAKKKAGGWPWVLGGYLPEQQPALWGALGELGRELRVMEPWLLAESWSSQRVGAIDVGLWRQGRRALVVAVNGDEQAAAEADLALPGMAGAESLVGGPQPELRDGVLHLALPAKGTAAVVVGP